MKQSSTCGAAADFTAARSESVQPESVQLEALWPEPVRPDSLSLGLEVSP